MEVDEPTQPSLTVAPLLSQVNRFNKSTDRALLVTDKHVYKLEPKKQYKVLKKLPLDTVSPHMIVRPSSVSQM